MVSSPLPQHVVVVSSLILLVILALVGAISDGPRNILVVGGSSGMGKAAAIACVQRGGRAHIVSRSQDRLSKAKEEIQSHAPTSSGPVVKTTILDATDEEAVRELSRQLQSEDPYDGLVISAAGRAPHGPMSELDTSLTRDLMDTKFWSAYHCAKYLGPILHEGSGVVFVAGVLNRRPGKNCAPLAATNGALEGLTRALALEWGPSLRVNCLSPGFCDTERFDKMDPMKKKAMLANTADSLPLQRTGRPEDMGEAIYYLLGAQFCTGIILDVDGGHGIRQYANPQSDPMRTQDPRNP